MAFPTDAVLQRFSGRPSVTSPGGLMPSDLGAGGLPVNAAEVLTEVAGIAAAPGTLAERAEALLAQVHRVVRFDAGWVALLPPDQDSYVPLARSGYDERIRGYLDSPSVLEEVELVGLSRSRRPIRGRDLPFPPSEVPGWAEYMEPVGFRDGVSTGLFAPEGRYLGVLALHMQQTDGVSEAARDLLEVLAAPIASALDPLRSLATIAGIVHEATAGIVLAPSGAVLPLPGLPDHRLLSRGTRVLTAATLQLAEGGPHVSFLAPLPEPEGRETHARITVLDAPPDLQVFAAAVVLVSPAGDLHGLSGRELQVLGLLVIGASNDGIAGALGITARTVEVHVDHVRAKLSAPSRTTAAARALRLGLFVPSPLVVRPGAPFVHDAPHGRPPS
jgi:DNA-binding CsgD family transcriptional regulator